MKTNLVEYKDGDVVLEGFYSYDEKKSGNRPLVLVAHDWSGRNEFAEKKAQKLAELGYIGFAIDMFGKGKIGKTKEEKMALITPFMNDRELLKKRILAALEAAKKIPNVDTKKIGAIGFCFGGLCVLDLARSGADVSGVVSFHGLLNLPPKEEKIRAKVLALHGHDDPMVPSDVVFSFQKEMTDAKVDWQMVIYGNTMHAFTNPQANDPGFGTVYSACADKRSWIAMKNFFEEIFA
jgi:dienelactone hydrolase